MAIQIQDEVPTDFGVSLPNLIATCQGFVSIGRQTVDNEVVYVLTSNVVFCTAPGARAVKHDTVSANVAAADLATMGNPFVLLYAALKARFNATTDLL
jgi:hypothetical protein